MLIRHFPGYVKSKTLFDQYCFSAYFILNCQMCSESQTSLQQHTATRRRRSTATALWSLGKMRLSGIRTHLLVALTAGASAPVNYLDCCIHKMKELQGPA